MPRQGYVETRIETIVLIPYLVSILAFRRTRPAFRVNPLFQRAFDCLDHQRRHFIRHSRV